MYPFLNQSLYSIYSKSATDCVDSRRPEQHRKMTLKTHMSYRAPLLCDSVALIGGSGQGHRVQALTHGLEHGKYSSREILRSSEHPIHSCRVCANVFSGISLVVAVWMEVPAMYGDWVAVVTGTVTLVEAGPIRSGFWMFAKTRRRATAALRSVT